MMADTIWLVCGVLTREMEELQRLGVIDGQLLSLDSMLHMNPTRLEETLVEILGETVGETSQIVLVYGDCSAGMLDLTERFRVGRVNAINCAQLMVGRDRYRQLMREEAFLVLPEWAHRWEHIMKAELGLNQQVAQGLMGENRGVLVYLDSGLIPVPQLAMEQFSAYCGLPWRIEPVSLDFMLKELLEAKARIAKGVEG